jgi:hypothetical protein
VQSSSRGGSGCAGKRSTRMRIRTSYGSVLSVAEKSFRIELLTSALYISPGRRLIGASSGLQFCPVPSSKHKKSIRVTGLSNPLRKRRIAFPEFVEACMRMVDIVVSTINCSTGFCLKPSGYSSLLLPSLRTSPKLPLAPRVPDFRRILISLITVYIYRILFIMVMESY